MDGWIGLSGCGCGKWIVEGGAVPDLTHTLTDRGTDTTHDQNYIPCHFAGGQ